MAAETRLAGRPASTSSTRRRARPRTSAALSPAGPPPTITTSRISLLITVPTVTWLVTQRIGTGDDLRVLLDEDRRPATPRIAAACERPRLGVARHGLHPAEVEVALVPALHLPAVGLERVQPG